MDGLFEDINNHVKCQKCLINKKGLCNKVRDTNVIIEKGDPDLLIVLEAIESQRNINILLSLLEEHNLDNYKIISGIQCETNSYKFPNPISSIYKKCNVVKEDSKYKCILTIGRGLQAVTQTKDLSSWMEFSEYIFNPTYFLTGVTWKKKIRVYPSPPFVLFTQDTGTKDNFEFFFLKKQLSFINDHLLNYNPRKTTLLPHYKHLIKDVNQFLLDNMDKTEVAIDTENTGLDVYNDSFRCHCITMSFDGVDGYYLKFKDINIDLFNRFLENKKQYYGNGKYDCKVLQKFGVYNSKMDEDIIILSHLLSTMRIKNRVKVLAWFLGFGGYDEDMDTYFKKNKDITWKNVGHEALFDYSIIDAIVTFRAKDYLLELAKKQPNVYENYKKYVIPVIPVFLKMEKNGLWVDQNYLSEYHDKIDDMMIPLEKEIKDELNCNIDLSSPQQLARGLEKKGFPCLGRSEKQLYTREDGKKVGFYLTGNDVLVEWSKMGFSLADKILKHRTLEKLDSSFVGKSQCNSHDDGYFLDNIYTDNYENISEISESDSGLYKYIMDDGYVHSSYSPAMTDAWRSKCSNPNAQQFVKDKDYRRIIAAPKDYVYWECDVDGFHLRISAIYSGDKAMEDLFCNGSGDMHSLTAQSTFFRSMSLGDFIKNKKIKPYKEFRDIAKTINFLFIYNGSASSLSPTIKNNWTVEEIDTYIDENNLDIIINYEEQEDKPLTIATHIRQLFFNTYVSLPKYMEKTINDAKKRGYLDSMQGARRHLPEMTYLGKDYNRKRKANLYSICTNAPILIFEAVWMYDKLIKIDNDFENMKLQSNINFFIHDAIGGLAHKDELEVVYTTVKKHMEDRSTYKIPFTSEFVYGDRMGYGDEIKSIEDIKSIREKYFS